MYADDEACDPGATCKSGGYYASDAPWALHATDDPGANPGNPDGLDERDRTPPAVEWVMAGDAMAGLQAALGRPDPEDRYLELILVAVASARRGDIPAARAAAARAVDLYRPIVEEGLYALYARYLTEIGAALPPDEIGAFVQVMEPEVVALGALASAADPPLSFLALYNDLHHAAHGWEATLDHARAHPASHLLLGDLARRVPPAPDLDQALADLADTAGREASDLAARAVGGADPFLRDRLRRALLRQIAGLRALFDRGSPLADQLLAGIPFDALARLPRGIRLEALQAMAAALEGLPREHRAALYPRFLMAAHPPGVETGSMLRRQAAAIARITAPFLDAEPAAAGDLVGLVDWFLSENAYLGEGAAEEASRQFARALLGLGERAGPSLDRLLIWAEEHTPAGCPAVLAAWAACCGTSPAALRPDCLATPRQAWRVIREAPEDLRPRWAAESVRNPAWNLRALLSSPDLDEQRAVADLLTYHPDPLRDLALAREARQIILGESGAGPYARTLELLGEEADPYSLAVLLDARVASRGHAAPEHDHALRQIVARALARDVDKALRLAAGFGTRNHVSWLLGSLLADGHASRLDPDAVRAADPHPFLLGAYLLETAGMATLTRATGVTGARWASGTMDMAAAEESADR